MQPAFYLHLKSWCLGAFCFVIGLLYIRVLSKECEVENISVATYFKIWRWLQRIPSPQTRQQFDLPAGSGRSVRAFNP
jgi:hypothetical protein